MRDLRPSHPLLLAVLLGLVGVSAAAARGTDSLPVDDAPPTGSAQAPSASDDPQTDPDTAPEARHDLVHAPAVEAPVEGIWAWVARLEGEVLSDEAVEAMAEKAEAELAEGDLADELAAPKVPTELYDTPEQAVTVDPLRLAEVDPDAFDIPIRTDREVQRWMRYFLGPGRKHFQRYLDRSGRYVPMMQDRLQARGLPRDLVYLSMIESGFNPHALSSAGAGGLWQFMPATGRMYDLRVDWWVDDRRDPVKSTEAAVAHLADLHRMFKGDWLLAWCAYNAGPGRVRRAMSRAGTKDFWSLARGGHLPRETANYPPKLMAAAILSKNAERYGFSIDPAPPLQVDTVEVTGAAALDVLAELAGLTVDDLKHLNPGLRRTATPAEGYHLNLPLGVGSAFSTRLAKVPPDDRARFAQHTVKRGETLGRIAARYDVSTDALVKLNRLQDADRIVVGMSLLVPAQAGRATPTTIALAAPVTQQESQVSGVEPVKAAERTVTYTVRAGDTLSGIAARYGVKTGDLVRWNSLKDPSSIRVGQALTIRQATWSLYEVRPGDSLGRIASRQGCTVSELRSWNDLTGDVIHPGQTLRIRK